MTPQEAASLQAIAAAFDNRKPDLTAAKAWALALDGLRVEDCEQAIVAHYRVSADWLMPATVRTGVRKIRQQRLKDHPPIDPPAEFDADDVRGYLAWRKDTDRRIADGEVIGNHESGVLRGERPVGEVQALMPKPERVTKAPEKRDPGHDARLAAARAELEPLRAALLPKEAPMRETERQRIEEAAA